MKNLHGFRTLLVPACLLAAIATRTADAGHDPGRSYGGEYRGYDKRYRGCDEPNRGYGPRDRGYDRGGRFDHAARGWQPVAELKASRDAKEIGLNGSISAIRIVCIESPVIINTVVVRCGTGRESVRVGLRMYANQEHVIELGSAQHATGLRISDDNRGRYVVYVR